MSEGVIGGSNTVRESYGACPGHWKVNHHIEWMEARSTICWSMVFEGWGLVSTNRLPETETTPQSFGVSVQTNFPLKGR